MSPPPVLRYMEIKLGVKREVLYVLGHATKFFFIRLLIVCNVVYADVVI